MRRFLCLSVLLAASVGCASPRFLEVDSNGGVLAMPSNSNSWPCYYRDSADKMLKSRYPNGYTIVKEEEVVVGVSSQTTGQTQTERPPSMVVGGSSKPGGFAGVAVPLGQTRQTHEETTTYHAQTEWRMYVQANPPAGRMPASVVTPVSATMPAGATNQTVTAIPTVAPNPGVR